jgi:hypothetical protein
LGILVPAVPNTGKPVWTVGIGLETPREAVPFEVHEVDGFVRAGVKDLIDVIVDGGKGFA